MGEPLGVKLDSVDEKMLYICKVSNNVDTTVGRYNATVQTNHIQPGDYLIMVNGNSDGLTPVGTKVSDALRQELFTLMAVQVVVSRPKHFEATLVHNGTELGLDISYSNYGTSLLIVRITDGLVQSSLPDVRQGDRILAINGMEGSPFELLQALGGDPHTITLKLSRPFCPCSFSQE